MRTCVTDYGAVGDGVTLNTAAFAAAVEACAADGGGTVSVPAGRFVTGTIRLQSHVYLELQPGAEVWGSPRIADYTGTQRGCAWLPSAVRGIRPLRGSAEHRPNPCLALVVAEDACDLGVIGQGTLDGRRGTGFPSGPEAGSPFLVVFSHCEDVRLEGVFMRRPGSFTNYLLACRRVTVRGLRIDSTGTACGDGIDFDGGQDVIISDCQIDAGDDGIGLKTLSPDEPCERFTITGCVIRSQYWGCIRIGPETAGDYRHITVTGCVFRDSNDGLKLQLCEDRVFEDFVFTNIVMDQVTRPFFITLNHYPFSLHSHSVRPPLGAMRRLQFAHISATLTERRDRPGVGPYTPYSGCVIDCLPGGVMEDLSFAHVRLNCLGGGSAEAAGKTGLPALLDFVGQYPESLLNAGERPAAAMTLRGARRVRLQDVVITCRQADPRCALVAEEVDGLLLDGVRAEGAGGLLRHYRCDRLEVARCEGAIWVLSPAQQQTYDAAQEEAARLDAAMAAAAALVDRLADRRPDRRFDLREGLELAPGEGGVVVVPRLTGCLTLTREDRPVGVWQVPEAYRFPTVFACRVEPTDRPTRLTADTDDPAGSLTGWFFASKDA